MNCIQKRRLLRGLNLLDLLIIGHRLRRIRSFERNLVTCEELVVRTYFAFSDSEIYGSGLGSCLAWAANRVREGSAEVVKIAAVRAGEASARIIGDVTADGFVIARAGRVIPTKRIEAEWVANRAY